MLTSRQLLNCGTIGYACPASYLNGGNSVCVNGKCTTTCNSGYAWDSALGFCRSTQNDIANWCVGSTRAPPINIDNRVQRRNRSAVYSREWRGFVCRRRLRHFFVQHRVQARSWRLPSDRPVDRCGFPPRAVRSGSTDQADRSTIAAHSVERAQRATPTAAAACAAVASARRRATRATNSTLRSVTAARFQTTSTTAAQ